jgi:CPA2 family monovalent cation:H+ antiporter-2
LKQAGVETASLLVIAIPNETAAVIATRHARQLNSKIRIITRTHFTSVGLEARQAGADEVIVEEQSVAKALCDILKAEQ